MLRPTLRFPGTLAARAFSTTPRAGIARLQLIGRLGAAPELVETSSGRGVVRYVVASDSGARDNRHTSWFRVASFAEGAGRDFRLGLKKGSLVNVEADARMAEYEDKDGNRKFQINLVERSIDVLSRPKDAAQEGAEEFSEAAHSSGP